MRTPTSPAALLVLLLSVACERTSHHVVDPGVGDAGAREMLFEAPCELMTTRRSTSYGPEGDPVSELVHEWWGADFELPFEPGLEGDVRGITCGYLGELGCPPRSDGVECEEEGDAFRLHCAAADTYFEGSTARVFCGSRTRTEVVRTGEVIEEAYVWETARLVVRR